MDDVAYWFNKACNLQNQAVGELQAKNKRLTDEMDKWNLSAKNIEEDLTFEAENKRLKEANDQLQTELVCANELCGGYEAELAKLKIENKFLLSRSMKAGVCSFRKERDTGASSNSIVAIAFGLISINEQVFPRDSSDLLACKRVFDKLPNHRKTKDVMEALNRAEQALKDKQ